jgi:hypothetical protein
MFVSLLLRVEDQAADQKFGSFKRARVAFRWRKASDPNHPSTYALIEEYYKLIGTWRITQDDSATTVHMAMA